jgi:hypothetical protein
MSTAINRWARQSYRILFTLAVIANSAVSAQGEASAWITYSPLPSLS